MSEDNGAIPPKRRTRTRIVAVHKEQAKPLILVPTLHVVEGPTAGAMRRFRPTEESSLTVGRTTDSQFVIDHPTVSGCHASFTWKKVDEVFQMMVEDLESTNGTTLNREKITRGIVNEGDLVGLGDVVLRFRMLSSAELSERDRLIAKATNADVDTLTGLGTRRFMEEQIPTLLAECDTREVALSLLVLDLDHFKRVNDTLGHQAGDSVLAAFGSTVLKQIRTSDTAIRYGGEEVLVFLPDSPLIGASLVAERLRRSIETYDASEISPTLRLTVSVGVAQRAPGEDFASLLRRADAALYKAKGSGRNRVEADPLISSGESGAPLIAEGPPSAAERSVSKVRSTVSTQVRVQPLAAPKPKRAWWQFWKRD